MDQEAVSRVLECAETLESLAGLLPMLMDAIAVLRSEAAGATLTTRSFRLVPDPVQHRLGNQDCLDGKASAMEVPQGGEG